MIGPAEIEEMRLEREEALTRLAETRQNPWPVFVTTDHMDEADRVLIGGYDAWIALHRQRWPT